MIDLTDKQEIARENGRKSHGPVTAEGKKRSSLNSITHGLASKCVVLANESEELYSHLLSSYQEQWQPANIVEQHLVTQMVNSYWRLRRIWSMETALFDSEMFTQKEDFEAAWSHHHPAMRVLDALTAIQISNPATLTTLSRYEVRYQRIYKSSLDQLCKLRRDHQAPFMGFQDPNTDTKGVRDTGDQSPSPDQPVAAISWKTRLLAIFLSILSALHLRPRSGKQSARLRNRRFCTNEPTTAVEPPTSNFHLPELFAWLSIFTSAAARAKADAARTQPEKPNPG